MPTASSKLSIWPALPTPTTSHADYDRVYEPAEDSNLLLDTFSSKAEISFLRQQFAESSHAPVVCEVGTGSGVVLALVTANAKVILGRSDAVTLGVDVNPFACQTTAETVRIACDEARDRQQTPANFIGCFKRDLTSGLLKGSLDMVIFNPPYVPTEEVPEWTKTDTMPISTKHELFQRDSHLLALACDGGQDGMETTNRLLIQLPEVLSECGVAYILLCARNHPSDIIARIQEWGSEWKSEIVSTSGKKAGWERLSVLRIWHATTA